ncbi:MAG TPA: hypothetical protein PKY42_11350 [Mesotoga sp.]|nr:hypothetical protein [Mesotoga sp.]
MTSTKILSIALIVFLAGVGLSASISGALLKLTEIAGLENKIAGDLEKSLTTINRFYCGGISYGDSLVGVSFSFFTGEEQPLTRDGIKDTTRDLASRSVAIPFLRQLSRVHNLSEIINLYFLPYSLKNLLISVSSTELIRLASSDEWVGTIVIVKQNNLAIQPDGLINKFVDYYIERLDVLVDTEPLQNTAGVIDYIDSNATVLEIDRISMWRVWLYGAAVQIHLGNEEKASRIINKLPEDAREIFSAKVFGDDEFLLAGDIFIIVSEIDIAFSYWAYGMQVNPLNKTLEERFEKYDKK